MEALSLQDAVADYLAPYEGTTLTMYRIQVRDWLAWCDDNLIDPLAVRRSHLEVYLKWRRRQGASITYTATMASVLRGLYRSVADLGLMAYDPSFNLRRPKKYQHSEGTVLTRDQAAAFLQAAGEQDRQTAALCTLLLLTGIRSGEAVALDVEDIEDSEPLRLDLHRKGHWEQRIAVAEPAASLLRTHVGRRRQGPVFRGPQGKRITKNRVTMIVADLADSIGVPDITPHSLRRSFCTLSRDAGVPDQDIMAAGGWAHAAMIDYYDMGHRAAEAPVAGQAISDYLTGK